MVTMPPEACETPNDQHNLSFYQVGDVTWVLRADGVEKGDNNILGIKLNKEK